MPRGLALDLFDEIEQDNRGIKFKQTEHFEREVQWITDFVASHLWKQQGGQDQELLEVDRKDGEQSQYAPRPWSLRWLEESNMGRQTHGVGGRTKLPHEKCHATQPSGLAECTSTCATLGKW